MLHNVQSQSFSIIMGKGLAAMLLLLTLLIQRSLCSCDRPLSGNMSTWVNITNQLNVGIKGCIDIADSYGVEQIYNFTSAYIRLLRSYSLQFELVFWSPRKDFQESYLSLVEHGSIAIEAHHMPVWTANPNFPVTADGALTICDSGRLCLRNGNGTIAWTSDAPHISILSLNDSGNLIMYDASGHILWQSFQHPFDKLVPGQRLTPGMSLKSNSSVYFATMYPGGLVVSRNTTQLAEPIPFRVISFTSTFSKNFSEVLVSPCPPGKEVAAVILGDGSKFTLTLQASCKELDIPILFPAGGLYVDYVRLDANGELHPYNFDDYVSENEETQGYLQLDAKSEEAWLGDCVNPEACGSYGICNPPLSDKQNKSCTCPNNSNSSASSQIFIQINPKDVAVGCKLAVPLQCNTFATQHQKLLEYKNITLVSMLIKGWNNNTRPLKECQELCIANCSCAAVFYDYNSSTCLLIPVDNVLTMIHVPDSLYSAFLKAPMYDQQGLITPTSSNGIANQGKSVSTHNNNHLVPAIVAPTLFILICVCFTAYFYMRKISASSREEDELQEKEIQAIATALPSRFSWRDLEIATNRFSRELGAGGFGSVYEGVLEDGRRVAVKKLKIEKQGHKQFLAEVVAMGVIGHINIVRLLGFCSEKSKRLLVYEYMENGSLDKWIYGHEDQSLSNMLSWAQRFAVAIGTVRGLTYLHDECTDPILHLDIKPQNILLDAAFVPRIADFGLSRPTDRAASMVMTGVRGTPGYIAPEWLLHSGATRKCDVYSFGMVLLELVAGRRTVCISRIWVSGEEDWKWHLPSWASEMFSEGRIKELVDKRLEGAFDMEQVTRMVLVALWCIQDDPKGRPEMAQVMKMLEGSMEIAVPPLPREVGSRI